MDIIRIFHALHGGFGIIALIVAIITLTVLWRLRGMLQWKRSLRQEFRGLKAGLASAGPSRRQAVEVYHFQFEQGFTSGQPEASQAYHHDQRKTDPANGR